VNEAKVTDAWKAGGRGADRSQRTNATIAAPENARAPLLQAMITEESLTGSEACDGAPEQSANAKRPDFAN
jgi:hypothetical protein